MRREICGECGAPISDDGACDCTELLKKRRPSGPVANGYYCHYCGKTNDLRPYGPKGAMVCFDCAMRPERKAEAEYNFAVQLDAAGPIAMIDGTEVGPYPAKHAKAREASNEQ